MNNLNSKAGGNNFLRSKRNKHESANKENIFGLLNS